MKKQLLLPPFLLAGALLSSCAVLYVPTTPSTPLLEKGQVEVTAGLRGLRYAEVGAAWSPLPHVLVTGELAADIAKSTASTTNSQGVTENYSDSHRQGGMGLGLYRPTSTTRRTYLAVMGGIGWGHTNFFAFDDYKPASVFFPFPLPTRQGVYDAKYRRYYGQLYLASPPDNDGPQYGASLRSVWVDYTKLTYADQRIVPSNRLFVEPSVFLRFGHGALRWYTTAGYSLPINRDPANPANGRTSSRSYLLSGGIILRPDLLKRPRD